MMDFRKILIITVLCLLPIAASAQSIADINAAKKLAESYGYSESEINNMVNKNGSKNNGNSKYSRDESENEMDSVAMGRMGKNDKDSQLGKNVKSEKNKNPKDARKNSSKNAKDKNKKKSDVKPIYDRYGNLLNPEDFEDEEEEIDERMLIYGHDFFESNGLGVIPSYNAPAPAGYVLGPGDEVILDIWGATVSHVVSKISNDGSITLEDYGPVYIAGMSISDAESSLRAQLSRVYSGLADDRGGTYLKLTIGRIKGVVINVAGEVTMSGAYTIPSLSSIPSLIYMAGGIKEKGSVRNINLNRQGRKVATFDLYDFVFKGKYDANLRLQDGDMVYVEPCNNVVSVGGAVMREMKYEAKPGETVADLLGYAGGFASDARRDEVSVTRKGPDGGSAYNVKAEDFASFKLQDGDSLSVRHYNNFYENGVTIIGPVKYPGTYALDNHIKDVASLISAAGGLEDGAFNDRGQIRRLSKSRVPVFLTFSLDEVMSGKEVVPLMRADSVTLFRQRELMEDLTITVEGHVNEPDTYTYYEGMTVADAILMAKGARKDAYGNRGQIRRVSADGVPSIVAFNVKDVMKGVGNVQLMREDTIRIYSVRELKDEAFITVAGNVNEPGVLQYLEGMTLEDALMMAQGFGDGADMTNIEVSSRGGRERGTVTICNVEEHPELMGMALRPYDVVSVRVLTYFRPQVTVTVNGEVISPGPYTLEKSVVHLSDVLEKTGGFTDAAYPHGARLVRKLTEEEMNRQKVAVMIANQNLDKRSQIDETALASTYDVGIDLEKAINNPGSLDDVALRDGDVISVPQLNNTVKVSGGVFYPNTVAFDKTANWHEYINQAGGFSKRAHRSKTYAVYMNGKVAVGGKIRPEPGMEIIVPERSDSERTPMSVAEIASLASSTTSMATMVATLVNLFKK